MEYFRIKNWKKHQHYKERNAPWIKLHTALFEDYEFQCLQDASKLHLILIWLIASRSNSFADAGDPILPCDPKYIQSKAGLEKPIDLTPLFKSGFLIRLQGASKLLADDSNTLATCTTETETETEGEGEGEKRVKTRHLRYVFLTAEQEMELREKLNGKYSSYLERLDGYIGQIGTAKAKKYKSHYDTILNWWRKDEGEKQQGQFDAPRN